MTDSSDMLARQKSSRLLNCGEQLFEPKNVRLHQWTQRGIEPQPQK